MTEKKELTRAELEVMQILWDRQRGFVNDIRDAMRPPKPAYNTVSTIVRILEQKGFVGHTAFGRTHEYHPLINRDDYTEHYMAGVLGNFFGGSPARMVSFLSRRENLSTSELDSIIGILEELKNDAQETDNEGIKAAPKRVWSWKKS